MEKDFMERISKLQELIDKSENIVFFGGAGVSTESGIPDFRSKDGLYNQKDIRFDKYEPEYLLSSDCLDNHPEVFFEFYRQKLDCRNIAPNTAHIKLAELEKAGKLSAVITQNIDGLHQKAGSRRVFEIHGTTQKVYCRECGNEVHPNYLFISKDDIPRCGICGGVLRPDVTLYGEDLPNDACSNAVAVLRNADLLIIGGTSLTVYPAALFLQYYMGEDIVMINRDITSMDNYATIVFREPIGKVMTELRCDGTRTRQ